MLLRQLFQPRLVNEEVKGLRRLGHQRRIGLHRRHQMIPHRTQIAAVIQLQEARAELRDIDFDRALGRTGFAGQTAGHRLFDLVREVIFPFARMPAVTGARHQRAQANALLRQRLLQLIGIDAAIRQQTQPFADQRRPPFRRVDALVADFHRRTHRTFYVKVEAQPVAITLHRPAPAAAHRDGDLPIPGATLHRVDFHHRRVDPFRRTDFPWVQAVIGIEDRFDLPKFAVQRLAKEGRAVLCAETFAMFPPQQAAILRR